MSPGPLRCGPPLSAQHYQHLVRRAIFECCKWRLQAEGRPVLLPFPLLLDQTAWADLCGMAEALAAEALAAEAELSRRPLLHELLGLPAALRRCLRAAAEQGATPGGARVLRIDFHPTPEGWRISEANTDVASGFIEAAGVTALMAAHYPGCLPAGDPALLLADAILGAAGEHARVGLLHLPVDTDDRQVMLYLARRMEERGLRPCLLGPRQVRWEEGQAGACCDSYTGPLDLVLRFLPAGWLPRLPGESGWQRFFFGGTTRACNPGSAVLSQSKRFPLTWGQLGVALPTWRRLLPETRAPEELADAEGADGGWILKPSLGYEGVDIGIRGVTEPAAWRRITRASRRAPSGWAAQRRFTSTALMTPEGPVYPCIGVYVIDGRAAGAYGRAGLRPLIDDRSREVVVLVARQGAEP